MVQPMAGKKASAQNCSICFPENGSAMPPCHKARQPMANGGVDKSQQTIRAHTGRTRAPAMAITTSPAMATLKGICIAYLFTERYAHQRLVRWMRGFDDFSPTSPHFLLFPSPRFQIVAEDVEGSPTEYEV